ncbi:NADH-quinone oxidoreductase subunit NuoE [Longibacter sp.]|jgi:NADH-quinone oxidoreductase subunit E|uniref:NADH-quinone oxidoreductase subunit NuoE family protein n=1 Tax=Longibacter sp. TaxID=2045415 RepID=UPI003EB9E758
MSQFDIQRPVVELPDQDPDPVFSDDELVWTEKEKEQIEQYKAKYPEPDAAIMSVLWMAQEKFGFLPPEVIQLCADTLDMPFSKAYGVATFYTQYYKEEQGKFVLDVCTCFTCQFTGGYDILHYLEEQLDVHAGETTEDGMFTLQEVECLGCCGSAPMMQVTNGPYVHNLTKEKVDDLLENLKKGEIPKFTSVTLPQDEDEMGGNRRSDAETTDTYKTQPRSKTIK